MKHTFETPYQKLAMYPVMAIAMFGASLVYASNTTPYHDIYTTQRSAPASVKAKTAPNVMTTSTKTDDSTTVVRAGTILAEEFRDKTIDYKTINGLSEPSQYQQWVKANHSYVLFNLLTNTVIRVVEEPKP
ncbi:MULTISPECIES: hypothetical protein [unclassified Acinetobacter]|uniref:hypothetical protein n=1 Tax=unclassified Acinetobacter TaxID=196816 RepID=UPI0035BABC1D